MTAGEFRVLFLVNVAAVTSVPVDLAGALARRGAEVEVIAFYDGAGRRPSEGAARSLAARSAHDLGAWRRLGAILRGQRPDVLHLHHTASSVAGALLGRRHGVPALVKTEHYDHGRARPGQAAANALVLGLVDRVVTNSRATLASFRPWERLLARGKAVTVHNGVDLARIEAAANGTGARHRREISPSSFLVGSVGRLIPVKRFDLLLEAVATARARVPGLELVIAGGGPREADLRDRVRRLGMRDRVRLTGEIGRRDVYELLGGLDLFVVSSRSEGFCNAAVEAMAAGVPVLCSDIPALREVVGDAGTYAAAGDPGAFAAGIERAAGWSEEERRERGEAGRRRARKRFSLRRAADRHLELYRSLLGGVEREEHAVPARDRVPRDR